MLELAECGNGGAGKAAQQTQVVLIYLNFKMVLPNPKRKTKMMFCFRTRRRVTVFQGLELSQVVDVEGARHTGAIAGPNRDPLRCDLNTRPIS